MASERTSAVHTELSFFIRLVFLTDVCVTTSGSLPRSGELRTQKLKSYLMKTHSLKVFLLKLGIGQYIAMHATLTVKDFFLANVYLPVHSPAFFSETSPKFFFLCRPAE